jgi:LysR family transcriptional regulator (chromosome initiation inhibitor)
MAFDLRKAEALLAVVETGSFEQAALRLHLTPSAISQRIRAMEEQLGQPLVVRARPCRTTPAGQKILLYLQRTRLLENEWRDELALPEQGWLNVAIAVNHDSLATWLLPALSDCLQRQRILLEIIVDDQSQTRMLLEQGLALAGISSQQGTLRGCVAEPLGQMRYRLVATPAFVRQWFAQGLTRAAALQAPLIVFNRKDDLQWVHRDALPCHFVPASESFMQAITLGIGYGLLPDLQAADWISSGRLLDLAPDKPTDVTLYWHRWQVQSPRLEALSAAIAAAAGARLNPLRPGPPDRV